MSEIPNIKIYEFTDNIIQSGKKLGIPVRNWVEAIVLTLITAAIIMNINFIGKVKIVVLLMICIAVFYVSLVGIKGRSLTQIVVAEYRYKKRRRKLHLRSVDYVRKQNNESSFEIEGDSYLEKFISIIKYYYKKYSDE